MPLRPRTDRSHSKRCKFLFSRTGTLNYPASAELNHKKSSKRGVREVSSAISSFLGSELFVLSHGSVMGQLWVRWVSHGSVMGQSWVSHCLSSLSDRKSNVLRCVLQCVALCVALCVSVCVALCVAVCVAVCVAASSYSRQCVLQCVALCVAVRHPLRSLSVLVN